MQTRLRFTGFGSYLPERVVTNEEITEKWGVSDEWIRTRTGVRERRACKENELAYHLAVRAAREAIEDAGIDPMEIDLLIYSTMVPEYILPGMGLFVQRDLPLRSTVPCLDIRSQCAGFLYGLETANMYLGSGKYRTILLICAERQHEYFTLYESTAPIFGDAASAVILRHEPVEGEERGLLDLALFADGTGTDHAITAAGTYPFEHLEGADLSEWRRALKRITPQMREKGHFLCWSGRQIFQTAVKRMVECTRDLLDRAALSISDIDHFLFHQANERINQAVAQRLEIPAEKLLWNIETYGNTTSATIPLLLEENRRVGVIRDGDLVLMCAFGAGYVWGAALYRF
ncbi:MAG: ketoacyl-ACP synthase III [Deltaproteobacteria bacterium]|nr:MAG: ketoacyl-ACP synthase III [Deltaproteobacteria bacterium]